MNRLALIAILVTLSTPALAASSNDTCKKISAMAAQAMEARQKGDLLEDAMSSVGDQSKFSEAMVMKAYKVRVFESSKGRATAIAEFQNAAYRECYEAFN